MKLAILKTPRAIAAFVVGLALFAVGFLPLFDGPGYEHSIATGLLVPIIAASIAAFEGFTDKRAPSKRTPLQALFRGAVTGAFLAAVSLATSFIHILRAGACGPLSGVATFALTAFIGCILAGVTGAAVSLLVAHFFSEKRARRRYAVFFAAICPLFTILAALFLFYSTPAVFAFDPYVGFFSGTLYDEVVDAYKPLLTYRAGTLCTLTALFLAAAAFTRNEAGRLKAVQRGFLFGALPFALTSLTLILLGKQLGHRTSSAYIREVLGGHLTGDRCEVVFPMDTEARDAKLMLRDCEEEIAADEARLGARGPDRIVAFFFRDAAQKRVLVGAADTYIAKPWRKEVYLQVAPYPHPVLGHELAHVIAGSFAPGPFGTAGGVRGWVPNPGLVEGVAVATSPDKDELTPLQWAKAMKELEILPRLGHIFGLGFLAENSSTAYTVAGSFIAWHLDRGEAAAVRAWYGGDTFEHAFGKSFEESEKEWRDALDAVELPPEARAVAKARFERPSIWKRRCPHVVERLRGEADTCEARGDLDGADADLKSLLNLDPGDASARRDLANHLRERGDDAGYVAAMKALRDDEHLSATWHARANEALGDKALRDGALDDAKGYYEAAQKDVLDEDWARTLDVKVWLTADAARAERFGRFLAKKPHEESIVGVIEVSRLLEKSELPAEDRALAAYLVARRLMEADALDEALGMIAGADVAEGLGKISVRLVREAMRMRVAMACLREVPRREEVEGALREYVSVPGGNLGRREGVGRAAKRCESFAAP